jgi:uncharacterized phage protein (TIGR01671 family)
MNREIKFRVWDKVDKEWKPFANFDIVEWQMHDMNPVEEYDFQQWTGCYDKNRTPIYEGDIIHYKFNGDSYPKEAVDRILTCSYDEDEGMYSFDDSDHSYYWAEIKRHSNIIGNIYENPELLKA